MEVGEEHSINQEIHRKLWFKRGNNLLYTRRLPSICPSVTVDGAGKSHYFTPNEDYVYTGPWVSTQIVMP